MSFFGNRRQTEAAPQPLSPSTVQPKPGIVPAPQPVGFETVLGANSVMEGTLKSSANVRLDGKFTGTLEITGNVLVGETAQINADIHAKNVSIAGAVRGNVSGKKVQLLRTGRIWGDIRAQALTTEEGAFIDGKITMITQEPPPTPEIVEVTAAPSEAVAASPVSEEAAPASDEPSVAPSDEADVKVDTEPAVSGDEAAKPDDAPVNEQA